MYEQLDIAGGSILLAPAIVPAVTLHEQPTRRMIRSENRAENCAHCEMNAVRWRRDRKSIPQWGKAADIIILKAAVLITQRDGSTLFLCEQHADEHDQRTGDHDG
jgi:hypothetical protein